jgi:hypothetical protein
MFTMGGIAGIPYFIQPQIFPEVIHVPMRAPGIIPMVPDPGQQSSRAECTAHVDIEAGFDFQGAEFSYNNRPAGWR